jgi:hypothetical protein
VNPPTAASHRSGRSRWRQWPPSRTTNRSGGSRACTAARDRGRVGGGDAVDRVLHVLVGPGRVGLALPADQPGAVPADRPGVGLDPGGQEQPPLVVRPAGRVFQDHRPGRARPPAGQGDGRGRTQAVAGQQVHRPAEAAGDPVDQPVEVEGPARRRPVAVAGQVEGVDHPAPPWPGGADPPPGGAGRHHPVQQDHPAPGRPGRVPLAAHAGPRMSTTSRRSMPVARSVRNMIGRAGPVPHHRGVSMTGWRLP